MAAKGGRGAWWVPRPAVALHAGAAALVVDAVADLVGELLNRLDEADVLLFLQEGVDVAALPATETMKVPVVGADVERRRLLVVEGAQTRQPVRTGTAQGDVVADDVLDTDLLTDGRDVAIGDSAWHAASVVRAGPGRALVQPPRQGDA